MITIDVSQTTGRVKPMHAVNNGPVYKFAEDQRITNIDHWRAAGIPYARTHDASFCSTYGGEHTVDIHAIFPCFDADPYDPLSYDFPITDEYMRVIHAGGTKVFYRLGARIEHECKKYYTLPPKDFHKWAVICEHIIRHYTEGWADGFAYEMDYWEIWNEPDLDADDAENKRTWGGTRAEFFDFFEIAAKHLKGCFPHLRIGGPAVASTKWSEAFLSEMQKREVPLDFFSWHRYPNEPYSFVDKAIFVRALMDRYGYASAECINTEWNYVRGWTGDEWLYSLRAEKGIKGAAFIAATMCACQDSPLDMMMYYDARPCGMNGMFSTDFSCDRLKGYYPFVMFNHLYRLGTALRVSQERGPLFACAAKNEAEDEIALLLAHFSDDDAAPAATVRVTLEGIPRGEWKTSVRLLDAENDLTLLAAEEVCCAAGVYRFEREMPLFSALLVTLSRNG